MLMLVLTVPIDSTDVPDQSLQHRVPSESHHTAITGHSSPATGHMLRNSLPSVVPPLVRNCLLACLYCITVGKLPDIPQLYALVFAVGDQVSAVLPGVNIGDSVYMTWGTIGVNQLC